MEPTWQTSAAPSADDDQPTAGGLRCDRCEVLPATDSPTGDVHCWFPTRHVIGKAAALLAELGIAVRETAGEGMVFTLSGAQRAEVLAALEDRLSEVERDDTRVLLTPEAQPPVPADLARVESLSRLMSRASSAWFLAMLRERRLTSHFQPIAHASDPGRIYGHEALLRGVAPDGALVPPGKLFDAARSAGFLFQLDLLARRSAIGSAQTHGLEGALFVNFAPAAIYDPTSCLRSTVSAIDKAGIARGNVVFEIVETDRAHDPKQLQRILDYYRKAGFRVALDDVGAGYSGLNLIHLLRPDIIKLDMELVRDVHLDPYKAQLAGNLLELAGSLGIEALAEGIESEGELEWVVAHGARYVQGFLLARPAPVPLKQMPARG
jgi:EAL domain-containing protein (putative c-di-GMP-specific phosphodiesterase class I)